MSEMAYAARKSCGCIVAAIMDRCPKKDIAKEVSSWVRAGFTIERLTVEQVRAEGWDCKHEAGSSDQTALEVGE